MSTWALKASMRFSMVLNVAGPGVEAPTLNRESGRMPLFRARTRHKGRLKSAASVEQKLFPGMVGSTQPTTP